MKNLQGILYNCVRQNELFFQMIQNDAVEGYIFWERGEQQNLLLDSKLSQQLELKTLTDLDKLKASKGEFLHSIIEKVENQLGDEFSENDIFNTSVFQPVNNTDIRFSTCQSKESNALYILAAIQRTTYFNRNRSITDISNVLEVAVWQYNVFSGEVLINEMWASLIGYSKKELYPVTVKTFEDLTHPQDFEEFKTVLQKYIDGESKSYTMEIRMRHKEGYWKWVLAKGKIVTRNEDGEVEWMMGSHIDITKRKIRENQMEILAQVPISTNNAVIISDANGKITFVNNAFEEITGYLLEEVLGKKPGDFLQGPLTDQKDIASFRKHLSLGRSFTQEILNYSKTGDPYLLSCQVDPIFNDKGEISKFISLQRIITEEKKNKEFLATFKNTLDQTEDCIFIFDQEDLKFTYVNQGAINMMGYTEEEMLLLHPYDLKPEFPKVEFQALIKPLAEDRIPSIRFQTIHRAKNGRDIPVEVFLQFIKNEKVSPHFVAVVKDITDQLAIEKELSRLSLVAKKTTNLVVITDNIGKIEYVNPAFEQKTGYKLEEVIGSKPGKFLHGKETKSEHIKATRAGLKTLKPFTQEILNYSRSGEKYWVSITFNPVFNESGELTNFIAIESDITEQKHKETLLRESEERLQFVLEGSELGYWDINLETGKTTMNDRYFELLGYTAENFEQSIHFYQSLVHPDDIGKLTRLMDTSFIPGGQDDFSMELRVKHKLGHYVWILDRGAVVKRDEKGTPLRISGTHTEFSRRKKLEIELQEERDFFSRVIGSNTLSLVIVAKSGKITFANRGAEKVLGIIKSEIEDKVYDDPDWRHITLEDEPFDIEKLPFPIVMHTKKSVQDIRHGIEWADGTKKYLSISGGPFNLEDGEIQDVIFSVADITERVKTQKQLDLAKDQMQSILKDMSDVVWSVDLPDYKMKFITPSIEKLTGFPASYYLENYQGNRWEERVYDADRGLVTQAYEDLDKNGSYEIEYRIRTKDNLLKWVLNKGTIIYKNGLPSRLDGYITDITNRKKQENSLAKYLGIVEDQNERLKNFTYIVSHNLRSHSANIQGLVYLINKKNPKIAENEYVKMLSKASNKLDETLHHLNNVVSVVSSTEEMEKINLSDAIATFLDAFENVISEAQLYFLNEISNNVVIEAVPAFLESIITNLLTNAIKYCDSQKDFSFVRISNRSLNGIVIMEVQDNGLGIDMEKYGEKLFGMYKTFHTHTDSRGLGLFLTKNQVESIGGKITVESKLGVGTTFKVFLKDGSI
ncbi:PAS domain S-box-containing protein [Marivirga sericea]|uniref:histidine kinase n=1 Tax=Marivirga sericea TaxID=1028 RepID=A0A1X7ID95_9BACT|nr:PAS domain S-box protein [Marivirga sericea]SMG12654.1 PAS domain S-box-containing protein [Marivirga sericea]